MTSTHFQILMLFWNMGLVDRVGTAAVENSSDLGIKTVLEPVLGLGTSYQFVRAAATAAERRQRIATLASFLAASAASIRTNPKVKLMSDINTFNISDDFILYEKIVSK